jgi:hypothetical protein
LRAEQLAPVSAQSFLGQIAFSRYQTQRATQLIVLSPKNVVLPTYRKELPEFVGVDDHINRHDA